MSTHVNIGGENAPREEHAQQLRGVSELRLGRDLGSESQLWHCSLLTNYLKMVREKHEAAPWSLTWVQASHCTLRSLKLDLEVLVTFFIAFSDGWYRTWAYSPIWRLFIFPVFIKFSVRVDFGAGGISIMVPSCHLGITCGSGNILLSPWTSYYPLSCSLVPQTFLILATWGRKSIQQPIAIFPH